LAFLAAKEDADKGRGERRSQMLSNDVGVAQGVRIATLALFAEDERVGKR
jgi:hypothetical protein